MEALNVKYFTPFLPVPPGVKYLEFLCCSFLNANLHVYHDMSTSGIEPRKLKRFKQPTTRGFEYYMNVVGTGIDINLKSNTPSQ